MYFLMMLFPEALLIRIVYSFVIASLLILISAVYFSKVKKKTTIHPITVWRKAILPVTLIGTAGNYAGVYFMFLLEKSLLALYRLKVINYDLYLFFDSGIGYTILALLSITVSWVLIYLLDRRFGFRKCELSFEILHKFALLIAFWSAPFFLLLPYWKQPLWWHWL